MSLIKALRYSLSLSLVLSFSLFIYFNSFAISHSVLDTNAHSFSLFLSLSSSLLKAFDSDVKSIKEETIYTSK